MMIGLYSVYDVMSETYSDVFSGKSDDEVRLQFYLTFSKPDAADHVFRRFPDKFWLHHIADFDCRTGEMFTTSDVDPVSFEDIFSYYSEMDNSSRGRVDE